MKKTSKKTAANIRRTIPPVLIIILILAAFLRFYKLAPLLHWTLDEEYWSYLPFNITTGYHLPLIGGHVSGTGLYSGPLFVWIMALPSALVNGNPLGIAAFVSGLGVITTAVMYWVGSQLFEKRTGLIAAAVAATSFLWVIYDRKYWNASPIPLLSLLTLLCLQKISQGRRRFVYPLAVILAVAFHAHMTSAVLLVFIAVGWWLLKLPVKKREFMVGLALFMILQLPLLLFEIRHDFLNTRAAVSFLSPDEAGTSLATAVKDVSLLAANTSGRLLYAPLKLDIAKELTLCSQYAGLRFTPPLWAVSLGLAGLAFVLINRKSSGFRLLLLLFLINMIGLIWYRMRAGPGNWYPGQLSEYFFFPSFPAFLLGFASMINWLIVRLGSRAGIAWLALATLLLVNAAAVVTATHSDGFAGKNATVKSVIKLLAGQPFTLAVTSSDPCRIYGYRYLFSVYGREPVASYLDGQFGWLYERRLPDEKPTKRVTIVTNPGSIELKMVDVGINIRK